MDETLTASTNRPITFSVKGQDTVVRGIATWSAGTEVYVTRIRNNGTCCLRIPGSLYTQDARLSDIDVP